MSARPRRLPNKRELAVGTGFLELTGVLRCVLASRLQGDTGLSQGDYSVLLALTSSDGQTLRSSRLAARIGWDRSRLSHHLGRMERRGLIRREGSKFDRRGANVGLTAEGLEAFQRATVPYRRAVGELFLDALTAEQLAAVEDITQTVKAHLDSLEAAAAELASEQGLGQ
jgi:DNA-binding MarR family transcriptional regulator